jgi:hypothetical protein
MDWATVLLISINTEERRKSSAVGGAQRRVEYFCERREWRVGRDGEGGRPALVLPAVGPLARVLGALELLGFEPAAVQMAPVRGAALAAASVAQTTFGPPSVGARPGNFGRRARAAIGTAPLAAASIRSVGYQPWRKFEMGHRLAIGRRTRHRRNGPTRFP